MIKLGSTTASQEVQLCPKTMQEKQAQSHIVPFSSKLLTIASYIHRQLSRSDLSVRERYFTIKGSSFMYKHRSLKFDPKITPIASKPKTHNVIR